MFRSRAVAYVKPWSSCRTVLILDMGNSFLTICLFISLTLLTTLTVLSFFGMMKVGKGHSESACHFNTPKCIVFGFPFLRSPHAFLVLGTVCHDMVVLHLSVGVRPNYNPSHPVFHQTAPQIIVEAPVTFVCLGHWGVCNFLWLPWDPPSHTWCLGFKLGASWPPRCSEVLCFFVDRFFY